jgi:hypothetical protein
VADNFVRFFDSVQIKPVEIDGKVKDYYANHQSSQNVRPLNIRIAATHAGKITRNNGFYLPHKMKQGATTFTDQYPKPVQVHHEDKVDPVGRVIQSRYVDISGGFRDSVADSFSVKQDQRLQDFVDGKLSYRDAINFANRYFIKDQSRSADPSYEGLGFIEIVASITDPDAIQKVLDGRYLTGSVGASTNRAVCSICKQNWASDGKCEHRPGSVYDSAKCVLIAGDLFYDEYSFVNKPADRHSRIIEVNVNGIQDFVELSNEDSFTPEIHFVIDSKNDSFQEDQNMTFKDAYKLVSGEEKFKGVDRLEDKVAAIVKEHKDLDKDKLFSLLEKGLEDKAKVQDEVKPEGAEAFFGDSYQDIVGNDSWGTQYAEMLYGVEDADSAISAADRAKLPASAFCGPDKSFPVVDAAHYSAAKKMLDGYSGPGDKDRILASIERKGKRHGWTEEVDNTPKVSDYVNADYFDSYSDQELLDMVQGVRAAIEERELVQQEDSVDSDENVVVNEDLTKENDQFKTRIDSQRQEIRYLHMDIENLTSNVADEVEATREAHIAHIKTLSVLAGEEVVEDELKQKNTSELIKVVDSLTAKVDMQKITDSISSGLSNSPTGTVENPTLMQDNTNPDNEDSQDSNVQLNDYEKSIMKNQWFQIRMRDGKEVADNWLNETCKNYGIKVADISGQE